MLAARLVGASRRSIKTWANQIDLTLLRRAYRILDHFIGDQLELPAKTLRKKRVDLVDQTITWCADWIERRGGRAPSPAERRAMRRHLQSLERAPGPGAPGPSLSAAGA